MRLLLATRNEGKLRELRTLLRAEPIEFETLATHPEVGEIEETGKSFQQNACIKASAAAKASGLWCLGEDSGLEVDALGGAPGIYSARFSGVHGDDEANNKKLLLDLEGKTERGARYQCVSALARPSGEILALSRGSCAGRIVDEPRGSGGFGYDPLFFCERWGCTMAELGPADKDMISHRGQALRALRPVLHIYLSLAMGGSD